MMIEPGNIVRVRSRQYLVEGIEPPRQPDECTLVRLSCIEDDAQGEQLEILWEREVDARVLGDTDWERIASRGFDEPRLFSAYLHTLRWNCVTATDPKLFQAPYRAGIEVKAYQLQPLRMALGMPRVNLFIADDVGLGKTIEAGLIVRELIMRQKVRRIVICVPPSVVRQWQDEMEARFGLTFVVYDREYVAEVRQQRGYAVNPWKTHTRFILSHALVRDEAYAAPLRDWLGDFAGGSLLILDEAHNVAPAGNGKYALDSKLTRAMRDLAPRFEHKLFLSATPHNGHSNSFSALLELLEPQRFVRGVPVEPKLRDQVMVRRLKDDLRKLGEQFPERNVEPIVIDRLRDDAPELVLSRLLQDYRRTREARLASATKSQQASAMLVVISLQKRLLSSVEAFARTLEVHRTWMQREARKASVDARQLDLLADTTSGDDERADLPEEDVGREEDAQMALASAHSASAATLGPELAILDEMLRIARAHRHDADPRVEHLIKWIRQHQCPELGKPGATWTARRVLIFTEYADTKRYLYELLTDRLRDTDRPSDRVDSFHGGMGEARREAIKAAFNADPARHPLRILIATDAAREGVNLQNHCADLFHFDVPWNPSRIEQRNGRIDRKLQKADNVYCRYFVLPQRAEDRVLDVLMKKTDTIHKELGSLVPVVARRIDQALARGIEHDRADDVATTIDRAGDGGDTGARVRTMRVEMGHDESKPRRIAIERQRMQLEELLERSRRWLDLDGTHFRDALSASLEIVGASGLIPASNAEAVADPARARWVMPSLHERKGADPTWAATLDTLRSPRRHGQSPSEWRREAPIRPVVFTDPGNLDGDVVHLHLEHRVVRRLLGRFMSQGFREDDLRRACVLRTVEAQPRAVLLGRLSLFGKAGSRLHDEILAAAAMWVPLEHRRGGLRALREGDKADVLRLVEDALAQPRLREADATLLAHLKQFTPRDVADLRSHLERRAGVLIERAEDALTQRGESEAREMAAILKAQRDRILERQREDAEESRQGRFAFNQDEERQRVLERRRWDERLQAIPRELESEPERIRKSYVVHASRIEAVGIAYLWPLSS